MARLIVTRPAREAAQWVAALQAAGQPAIALPLIAIAPCSEPAAVAALHTARTHWAQGQHYRAALFVSSNAVRAFFESNCTDVGVLPSSIAIKTRAWSPGPGTALALREAGVHAQLIDGPADNAPQFDSESLWQQVAGQITAGDRVLIVRGRSACALTAPATGHAGAAAATQGNGRDWLSRQIAAAGGSVDFVAAYERRAPQLSAAEQDAARAAASDGSVWLFSSSEAVSHLQAALPGHSWQPARALCTHPRIAQAARAAGFGQVWESRPALTDVMASIESAP